MRKLVCRSLNNAPYRSRLIFLNDGGEVKEAEGQKKGTELAPMSPEDKREYAKSRYEDAKSEMANIEESFGKPDKKGELPSSAPKEIAQEYKKLSAIAKKYEATKGQSEQIRNETIRVVEGVYAALENAARPPVSADGTPPAPNFDPLVDFAYKPRTLREKPLPKAEEAPAQKPTSKAKEVPAQKSAEKVEKKEPVQENSDRMMSDIALRVSKGDTNLSSNEVALLRKNLTPGQLDIVDMPNGQKCEFEMSVDKKFVRVRGEVKPGEGTATRESFMRIMTLDPTAKGKPEFALKTKEEVDSAKIDLNNKDLDKELTWLESEAAPLGSTVLIHTQTIDRKTKDNKDEQVFVETAVRKGVDGFRVVRFESIINSETQEKGKPVEVKSEKYTADSAHAFIKPDSEVISIEGDQNAAKEELRFKLNKSADKLIAHYMLGGTGDENFKTDLQEIKKVVTDYKIGKYSFTDKTTGRFLVKIRDGNLSIEDTTEPNPEYKSAEETPDKTRYAVKSSVHLEDVA